MALHWLSAVEIVLLPRDTRLEIERLRSSPRKPSRHPGCLGRIYGHQKGPGPVLEVYERSVCEVSVEEQKIEQWVADSQWTPHGNPYP